MVQVLITEQQVQEAFLAAPPLLSQQILDLTIKHPSFLRDLPELVAFPLGNGTVQQQLVIRGAMPQIERGFAGWKTLENNTGCAPCEPNCAYNTTMFGGHGIERKETRIMSRDFRSPSYCIKEIQTTAHFKEIFAKVVEILYSQVDFFKEQNVVFNALTSLAKKYVVDSTGPRPNTANPYVYPAVGTTRLSMLTMDLLEFFYEYMRRMPDAIPYDVVDGSPIFSLMASHQTLARLYRDDPQLRQDVRFSGLANDLLMKYNFMSTIRGMFIAAPILYPRRFNVVGGVLVEVLPFVNGIPMEVGAFTGFNPGYESATHEEILIHGKWPFKILYQPTLTSLGANTSFGPEYDYFNNWSWVNPLTVEDYFRRVGFFATSATIGIAPQHSDAIFGIVVERPRVNIIPAWLPAAECPPVDPTCDNTIPDPGCPCPLILGFSANPITAGNYYITLAVPTTAVPTDVIQFGLTTGGYISGTVVAVSADGLTVEVTFVETLPDCDNFTSIFCGNTLGCSALVTRYAVNCTNPLFLDLILSNPIKADTAADVVTLTLGDGTTISATVVSFNMLTNTWTVDPAGGAFCDQVCGVVAICVPTATDATCPACGGPTFEQCEEVVIP